MGVACECAKRHIFAQFLLCFCALISEHFCALDIVELCAQSHMNVPKASLCNIPFNHTPFFVSPKSLQSILNGQDWHDCSRRGGVKKKVTIPICGIAKDPAFQGSANTEEHKGLRLRLCHPLKHSMNFSTLPSIQTIGDGNPFELSLVEDA